MALSSISEQIKLRPNPFKEHVIFDLPIDLEIKAIVIFNQNGQSITAKEENLLGNQMSTANLPSGMYWYKITTNKGVAFKKGIKL